jgi:hypothetical protein
MGRCTRWRSWRSCRRSIETGPASDGLSPVFDRQSKRQEALVVRDVGGCQRRIVGKRRRGNQDIGHADRHPCPYQRPRDLSSGPSTLVVESQHFRVPRPRQELGGAIALLRLAPSTYDFEDRHRRDSQPAMLGHVRLHPANHVDVLPPEEIRQDVGIKQGSVHPRYARYLSTSDAPALTERPESQTRSRRPKWPLGRAHAAPSPRPPPHARPARPHVADPPGKAPGDLQESSAR